MQIGVARLTAADTRELMAEHQRRLHDLSPPGTSFALDLSGLASPDITIFEARRDNLLLGVGALKHLGDAEGEIKAMRTADHALRRGVGQALLAHIMDVAKGRRYARVLLETGTGGPFEPANRMYVRNGFRRRDPFGSYTETGFNIFYELAF